MMHLFHFVKYNLIKQLRTNRFLLTIVISIFLGFICVPSASMKYEIFYLGGARGIYNSAWLGALAAALSMILLWLPGFYMLRSQISEDERIKIGQVIASTPMSKINYISSIAISNFVVLATLEIIFLAALVIMQLIRHESTAIEITQYLQPLLFITIPNLILVAALTVIFDVIPFLKSTFGNVVIFALWTTGSSLSVAMPNNKFDLFGIGMIISKMIKGAQEVYPSISSDSGSFGYYTVKSATPTFEWAGITWDKAFLISRLCWIAFSILLVIIAACIFDRFREHESALKLPINRLQDNKMKNHLKDSDHQLIVLSPVTKLKRSSFLQLLKGEFKIMFSDLPKWWYLCVLAGIVIPIFVKVDSNSFWVSLVMIIPLSIWSQMGCREKYYFTDQIVLSSCSKYIKFLSNWTAGVLLSVITSLGVLINFVVHGHYTNLAAWFVGILFVPTLAIVAGSLAKNRKLFEAIYIAWFYFGPINNMGKFDFLGISTCNIDFYLPVAVILFVFGLFLQFLQEKHIMK